MALLRPTPWVRQPQVATEIDWSNPITRGLVLAATPIGEAVTGQTNGVVGTTSISYEKAGVGAAGSSGTSYRTFTDRDSFDATGAITILCGINGTSGSMIGTYLSKGAANTNANPFFFGRFSATSLHLSRGGSSDWQQFTLGTLQNVPNGYCVIGVTQNGVLGAGAYCNFYLNGVTPGVANGGGMANSIATANANPVRFAGISEPVFWSFLWGRVLSDAEIKSISANPWQIFKPIPRRIFVPVSGGSDVTGTGLFSDVTITPPSASATGSASVTAAIQALSLTTPLGSASATSVATATGVLQSLTLSPPAGAATGSALATAALPGITLTVPSGTAVGSSVAAGSFSSFTLSAPTGTAAEISSGSVLATGALALITISAPTAIAIGSAVATGGVQTIGLTAPNGSAVSAPVQNGTALGALPAINLLAPAGYASSGNYVNAPSGSAYNLISPKGSRPNQSITSRPSNTGGRRR